MLALVSVFWGIALLYNIRPGDSGFAGNLVVAVCIAMTVLPGGITAGTINRVLLTFAALAFFFDLGEEVASDAMDVRGDQLRSSKSGAKSWGRASAIRVAGSDLYWFFVC